MNTLILAGRMQDAQEYARLAGLKKFTWRWPSSAAAVQGTRAKLIIELPSFHRRPGHFAIDAALKPILRTGARRLKVTERGLERLRAMAAPKELSAPEHLTTQVGEQLDIFDELGGKPEPLAQKWVREYDAEPAPKPKPAKKAAAKKVAAKAPAADDFFGV